VRDDRCHSHSKTSHYGFVNQNPKLVLKDGIHPFLDLYDPIPDSNAGGGSQTNSLLHLVHQLVFALPVERPHPKQQS